MRFQNRTQAGRQLAGALQKFRGRTDVVVLALPRGGVPVAVEVAGALQAPLDLLMVRKLGLPWQPEVAMGAVTSDGTILLNQEVVDGAGVSESVLRKAARHEWKELQRRQQLYLGDRSPLSVAGKTVIVVDDGVATGSTVVAAARALRGQGPARVVLAFPVVSESTYPALLAEADEVVCLHRPTRFRGVGAFYEDFSQVSDRQVCDLLSPHQTKL